MKTLISEKVMVEAINLSAKWNNTGFVVINESGVPEATVWNNWKWEDPQKEIIAYVNDNDGFRMQPAFENDYDFAVEPKTLL